MEMKKKRILVLTTTYFPQFGGAERMLFELYKRLSDEFEIHLLTPNFGGKEKEFNGYFTIHRVCSPAKSKVEKFYKYQRFLYKKGKELMEKKKFDLIHCHYIFPTTFVAKRLKREFGVPILTTEHHFGTGMDICSHKENPFPVNSIMRSQVRGIDYLVSTGATQNEFLDYLGKGKLTYDVINLGGDCEVSEKSPTELFKELKLDSTKKYVFSVGRLVQRKRTDMILDAARLVVKKRSDIIFLIAGKGPEYERMKNLVEEYQLQDTVLLLGFVEDKDVAKYRKISTFFVSASEFEGAGITYFEAFASHLPALLKRNIASLEAVKDRKNGFLFDTYQELSKLIIDLVDQKEVLKRVEREGFKSYQQRFNWDQHAKQYSKLYKRIFNEK